MPYYCQCGCKQEIHLTKWHRYHAPRFLPGHNMRVPEGRVKPGEPLPAVGIERFDIPTYYCECGCKEIIPSKISHRWRQPHFITGHRVRLYEQMRDKKTGPPRREPPPDWMPRWGICECGCGQRTEIVTHSNATRGEYIGYPRRFILNHHQKTFKPEQNSQWKGGRWTLHNGYIMVRRPDHPSAKKSGYILEHRLVYEESRGVRLPPDVAIHHIDGVRWNNVPENLMAIKRGLEHQRVHSFTTGVISLFYDDRLLEACKAYVREHATLPDLGELTQQVYGHKEGPIT